jgi:hypothetical protein
MLAYRLNATAEDATSSKSDRRRGLNDLIFSCLAID